MSKISLIATKSMDQFCHSSKCIDSEVIQELAKEENIGVITFPETIIYSQNGQPTKIFIIDNKDLPKLQNLVWINLTAYLFERLSDFAEIKKALTETKEVLSTK